jgi:hypothetical protein
MTKRNNLTGDPEPPDGVIGNSAVKTGDPKPDDGEVQAYEERVGDPEPPDGSTGGE